MMSKSIFFINKIPKVILPVEVNETIESKKSTKWNKEVSH